jgi:hypothetical protein
MYPNVSDEYLDRWIDDLYGLAAGVPDHPKFFAGLPQLMNLANNYEKLWKDYHVVFPDVHAGNLGYRIFDGAGVEPQCVEWKTDLGDYLVGASVLCLDLGIASGSGLKGKEVLKLNPPHYLKGWLDMIPRL